MSLTIQIPTSKRSFSDQSTMVGESSSSLTPQSPFSTLLEILKIMDNTMRERVTHSMDLEQRCREASNLLQELKKLDVLHIQKSLEKLRIFEQDLGKRMNPLASVEAGRDGELQLSDEVCHFLGQPGFHELTQAAQWLKNQLPPTSYYKFPESMADDHPANDSSSTLSLTGIESINPPTNYINSCPTLICDEYNNLTDEVRKCLWCFLFFPENGIIKKRVLINWWIGEGLLPGRSALEGEGEELLKLLEYKQQLIKRVVMKKRGSDSWFMEPSVRSFIRSQAQDGIDKGVRLLESGVQVGTVEDEEVTTVFNVNKSRIEKGEAEWLASMKSLKVVHLGRNQKTDSTQNNIPVDKLELFMKDLKGKKKLRLLSLQGISSPDMLPASVCRLVGLIVLDLRACPDLKALPWGIRALKNLRHLDTSGCHALLRMPKGIRDLSNLEVMKGFVVAAKVINWLQRQRTCTLDDLGRLKKLHKLSLFVSRENFPTPQDLVDLDNIKELRKLKIMWNPSLSMGDEGQGNADNPFRNFLENRKMRIEKLDLWCPPKYTAPKLMDMATAFPAVKKLYIRGADFDHLNSNHDNSEGDKWRVETLRLLRLPELEMSWQVLKAIFPRVTYLEVQDCPKLQFSELDEEGVWECQPSSPDPVEL